MWNTPDTPDSWSANKMFHNNLCVFIIISALLYLIPLLSLHQLLVYPPFLYIFCMLNVVKMWQGNIVLRNISGVTEGVHWVPLRYPREKNCPFYRNTKMLSKLSIYFLPHFHFSPAIRKCYYVFISTGCQNHS